MQRPPINHLLRQVATHDAPLFLESNSDLLHV